MLFLLAVNSYASFVIGAGLNSLLLWLVAKQTSDDMHQYRYITIQLCTADCLCLILVTIVQPIYLVVQGSSVVLASGYLITALSHPWRFVATAAWLYAYYFALVSSVGQSMHRYAVVCNKKRGGTMLDYCFVLAAGGGSLFVYMASLFWAFYPYGEFELERQRLENVEWVTGEFFKENGDDGASPRIAMIGTPNSFGYFFNVLVTLIVEVGCYSGIAYGAFCIHHHFRTQSKQVLKAVKTCHTDGCKMIKKNQKVMSRQMVSAVIRQSLSRSILPLVASAISVFLAAGGFFAHILCLDDHSMDVTLPAVGTALSMFLPWIPALNPLITMLMVASYRRYLLGWYNRGVVVPSKGNVTKAQTAASPQ